MLKAEYKVLGWLLIIGFSIFASTGCQSEPQEEQSLTDEPEMKQPIDSSPTLKPTEMESTAMVSTSSAAKSQDASQAYGFTHQQADGNRIMSGIGSFPNSQVIDVSLEGKPVWIAAAPSGGGSLWTAVLEGGRVQAFQVVDGEASPAPIRPQQIGQLPPVLKVQGDQAGVLAPGENHTDFSPPVEIADLELQAFVQEGGSLAFAKEGGSIISTLPTEALQDGRLLLDEQGRILFLSGPTAQYEHGVLGDNIEASGITLVETVPQPKLSLELKVDDDDVIEGIMPLWIDINGDGSREIIVTQSNDREGARIVVYEESGQIIGQGPAIGRGYRWRHQLAVGSFGPEGETELVDVLTPHIGGVVEFYQLIDDELVIVASVPGFTSHVIGTRNLDMAAAGDFDGDGSLEILLPNQARTELSGIRRTKTGAEVAWTVPIDGQVVTNVASVNANGLAVGVGRDDGLLRIWLP